jgi:NTP pyrophosphatase (non-canonical NTP hydrolase)
MTSVTPTTVEMPHDKTNVFSLAEARRLDLDRYQTLANTFAVAYGLDHFMHGMVEEAGELVEKAFLGGGNPLDEAGDVLWYVSMLSRDFMVPLSELAARPVEVPAHESTARDVALRTSIACAMAAGVMKRVHRGDGSHIDITTYSLYPEDQISDLGKGKLLDSMAVILHLLSELAVVCSTTIEEVAFANIAKLRNRKQRHVIQGAGDNR